MKTKGTVYVSVLIMLFTLHRGIALADENATKELPKPLLPRVRSHELPRQDAKSKSGPLKVVVIASTNEVRLKESFKVALHVENISKTDQTIRA